MRFEKIYKVILDLILGAVQISFRSESSLSRASIVFSYLSPPSVWEDQEVIP